MMTKKDYEMIAAAIHLGIRNEIKTLLSKGVHVDKDNDYMNGFVTGQAQVIAGLCKAFEMHNPRFNEEKFIEACGISKSFFENAVL